MMHPDVINRNFRMIQAASTRTIRVWDLPLRLFHWSLLICVTGAIVSMQVFENIDWHQRFGYAVLALIIFRIMWGFAGSRHARFLNFIRGPGAIKDYLARSRAGGHISIGHNPLGALSVLALLLVLIAQAVSGLFLTDEIMFEAPLFKYISEHTASLLGRLHHLNANLIFILIGLHLAAILFYRFVKRDNLVTPMVTGRKAVPLAAAEQDAEGGATWLGLLIFVIAAALVWGVTRL